MIKEYIDKISSTKDNRKMEELSKMLVDLIYDLKESHHDEYEEYKEELYELAYGKKISEDMAIEWVNDMRPIGEYWSMEDTTNAMQSMGYSFNPIDFYVVANMMMNDYNDLTKEDEELALRLAYDWLNDVDAKDDKLYCYWKHIVKK